MRHEKVYLLTDACMWEQNKQNDTYYPHAVEVVDLETGQVRFIKSGSKIAFIEGNITDAHTQETYNKATRKVSNKPKNKLHRANSKTKSKDK